jgi:hypothetical protein
MSRIRLRKAWPSRPARSPASTTGSAGVAEHAPAEAEPTVQVAEPVLPRRQPKVPLVKVDRTPVDLTVLRKVLDALNEHHPLIGRTPPHGRPDTRNYVESGAGIWHAGKVSGH